MASETSSDPASWLEWQWFDAVDLSLRSAKELAQAADSRDLSGLFSYLDSVVESSESFRLLAYSQRLRDAYVIARVIYETSLNACFVLTNPPKLSDRAYTHARQKALRNVVRAIEVAGEIIFKVEMQGAKELLQHPEHRKLLDKFTTKSGREVASWTPENVPQRLEAVYQRFGPSDSRGLAFGLLLYRHASEVAHGTLFGTLFSWGAMELGKRLTCPEDLGIFRVKELKHLIKLVAYSNESVVRILSSALGKPVLGAAVVEARKAYYRQREVEA